MPQSSGLQATSEIGDDNPAGDSKAHEKADRGKAGGIAGSDKSGGDPLVAWNIVARRTLIAVGLFSIFVNVLMMTLPVYLFQLSDRVLTSRSLDTLVMLSIVALEQFTDLVNR
jgi:ATP-binding cassette subfamily C protein